ncbi:MAG: two-component system, NtrC family, nitrogen regulation response regulator NtrX [Acidobacteriota bacterium]|jgi:DNA-binding NtrC family response regulator|nr:two-component system, NtrC family, nitrogen regulation response regulator NtrX [Acidobacteriota bacterium]
MCSDASVNEKQQRVANRRILIIDDDPLVVEALEMLLADQGWDVRSALTARDGYVQFSSFSPDAVLLDVQLPDGDGIDVLQQLKDYSPDVPVIMMSGAGAVDRVVAAMQAGAETFLQKPFVADTLNLALSQAARLVASQREVAALRRGTSPQAGLVGISAAVVAIHRMLEDIAPAATPVIIEGESGSGKGVVARAIHERSTRAKAPFIDLNCAGLSRELLESELFGHEKGAFTGATATKQGLFEIAAGGTLFLDEIGEMDPSIQARLLKAIEDRQFRRVGGLRDLHADFRLIAATNRTLLEEVAAGRFRKDLYYRLNVITIKVPPLRKRPDDIPLLTQHLLRGIARDLGREPLKISERTMQRLTDYPWPGNVRELRNVLERSMLLSRGAELVVEWLHLEGERLPMPGSGFGPLREAEIQPLERITEDYIRRAVEASRGNMRKAARLLQVAPSTLYSRLKKPGGEDET